MSHDTLSRRGFLAASAAAVTVADGLSGASAQTSSALRVRADKDLQTLDPGDAAFADLFTSSAIFNQLIRYKSSDKWESENDIAELVEQVDPAHIRFRLRQGVQWTNGYGELTAEDVKFSYERIAKDDTFGYHQDWEPLDRVDVEDPYNGVIVLKTPTVMVKSVTMIFNSGTIVCRKAVEELGGKITTDPKATSGPFLIKEWQPKQKLTLARNDLWNGEQPDFDTIELIPIDDENAAALAFEAGELDYTKIGLNLVEKYKAAPPAGGTLMVRPQNGIEWMGMNTTHPPLDDQRVRRAIQLAVDVDAVLAVGYFGLSERATGMVAPGLVGHRDKLLYGQRDVEKAKALLAEAGHPDGFKVTLSIINKSDLQSMAQVIQASLAEVGIQVEILPYEAGTFWTLGMESEGTAWKDLQLIIQQWSYQPDSLEISRWFVPEQVGVWNWERWSNDEFGKMHNAALTEFDETKRAEMMVMMQDMMEESGAYLWFSHGVNAILHRDTIVPAVSPDGSRPLYHKFKRA